MAIHRPKENGTLDGTKVQRNKLMFHDISNASKLAGVVLLETLPITHEHPYILRTGRDGTSVSILDFVSCDRPIVVVVTDVLLR